MNPSRSPSAYLAALCSLLSLNACSGGGARSALAPSPGTSAAASTKGSGGTAGAAVHAGQGTRLFTVDFQSRSPGPYSMALVEADFRGAPTWNNGLDAGRATVVSESSNHFLRVTYPASKYGPGEGGVQFMVPLGKSYDELYLSYRLRFGDGFQPVKGGKLPGLVGGTAPTGCISDTDGFSARGMWREATILVQYLYHPEKANACGDDFVYLDGAKKVAGRPKTWMTIEHHLVMNHAGLHDGTLQARVDGVLVLDRRDFLYRATGKTFGIDALYFSTFYGGNDPSWAPTADQTIDYDDFVVSTGPISP